MSAKDLEVYQSASLRLHFHTFALTFLIISSGETTPLFLYSTKLCLLQDIQHTSRDVVYVWIMCGVCVVCVVCVGGGMCGVCVRMFVCCLHLCLRECKWLMNNAVHSDVLTAESCTAVYH